MGTRFVSDALDLMRTILGRNNRNDPSGSNDTMLTYLNNFVSLSMSDDIKIFEQYGTYTLTIDESTTDGVYTFNDGINPPFVNLLNEAMISIRDPINNSVSWNSLLIYYDPKQFYDYWGINNEEILVRGYPTEVLYYGNEFVFRTLPEQSYLVQFWGYKQRNDFADENEELPYDHWLKYVSYGAALDYALDYRYDAENLGRIKAGFSKERKYMMTRQHNNARNSRCQPRF